jgi:UDP-glucose 4-epimerase
LKALVTGARGFIGQHLVRRLFFVPELTQILGVTRQASCGIDRIKWDECDTRSYREVYCDLTNENAVARLMLIYKPDIIFHLAGNPVVKQDPHYPLEVSRTNILGTHALLAYSRPGARFVFASSATVYGNYASACMGADENTDLSPNSVYGATKVASEALVGAYHHLDKVSGLSLRYVANVGAGATHGVVKDLVAKLKSDSTTLDLLGDRPGSEKPYVHVLDTVEATVLFGLDGELTGALNVSSDTQLNIEQMARVIMDTLGIEKPLRWMGEAANWKGDNRVVRVDNFSAKYCGWRLRFPRSADAVAQAVKDMEGLS